MSDPEASTKVFWTVPDKVCRGHNREAMVEDKVITEEEATIENKVSVVGKATLADEVTIVGKAMIVERLRTWVTPRSQMRLRS